MLDNFTLHTPDINNLKPINMETYIKKSDLIKFLAGQQEALFAITKVVSPDLVDWYLSRSQECGILIEQIKKNFV